MVSEYKKELEELKSQNDQLAKTLGKVTIERNFAVEKQGRPKNASVCRGPRRELGLIK
jgi:hypothetical protein